MNYLEHLINNTYQVLDDNGTVLFQGSEEECEVYMFKSLLSRTNLINIDELLDAFKKLEDK